MPYTSIDMIGRMALLLAASVCASTSSSAESMFNQRKKEEQMSYLLKNRARHSHHAHVSLVDHNTHAYMPSEKPQVGADGLLSAVPKRNLRIGLQYLSSWNYMVDESNNAAYPESNAVQEDFIKGTTTLTGVMENAVEFVQKALLLDEYNKDWKVPPVRKFDANGVAETGGLVGDQTGNDDHNYCGGTRTSGAPRIPNHMLTTAGTSPNPQKLYKPFLKDWDDNILMCGTEFCTTKHVDVILYVQIKQQPGCPVLDSDKKPPTEGLIASAIDCKRRYAGENDINSDRPIMGMINFCPHMVNTNERELMETTAIHEIFHALGFGIRHYAFYRNPDGTPRTPRTVPQRYPENDCNYTIIPTTEMSELPDEAGFVGLNPLDITVQTGIMTVKMPPVGPDLCGNKTAIFTPSPNTVEFSLDPKNRGSAIVTPNVVKYAQHYFDCDSIKNMPLENSPTASSCHPIGSHWETRLLIDDVMGPMATAKTYFTAFTLKLLEDSGWYQVDYNALKGYQQMPYGFKRGCCFFNKKCIDDDPDRTIYNQEYFCKKNMPPKMEDWKSNGCSPDRRWKAICDLSSTVANVPERFQYFDDKQMAGISALNDHCPRYQRFKGFDDQGATLKNDCTIQRNDPSPSKNYKGEIFGPFSRCLATSLMQKDAEGAVLEESVVGCYEIQCNYNKRSITVTAAEMGTEGEIQSVECPAGSAHQIMNMTGETWVFTGNFIQCPAWEDVCSTCPNDCSGHGACDETTFTCDCDSGCTGFDCSIASGEDECSVAPSADTGKCEVQDPVPFSLAFDVIAFRNQTSPAWEPDLARIQTLMIGVAMIVVCVCCWMRFVDKMKAEMEGPDPDAEKLGPQEDRMFQDLLLVRENTFQVEPSQEGRMKQLKELTLLFNMEDLTDVEFKAAKKKLLDAEAARSRHKAAIKKKREGYDADDADD